MRTETTRKLVHALKVMTLDRRIRAFLDENDPKAVEQAEAALGAEENDLREKITEAYALVNDRYPSNPEIQKILDRYLP